MLETKANKRKLRELAGLAYRRELGHELAKLEMDFTRWRGGEIDPFELSERIHRFHDGVSRDLYVTYRDIPPLQTVPRAIACQVLDRTEVPVEILNELEPIIEFFAEQVGPEEEVQERDGEDGKHPGTRRI
jgi:hypothetical protein